MKLITTSLVLSSLALATLAKAPPVDSTPVAVASTNLSGPKIVFATPVYDFGKVKAGLPIKYTFVYTNAGNELLVISNVQPSCGCTTAGQWTRQVEPGKTGEIPMEFHSGLYGGQVLKTVRVVSNDKTQPSLNLQIKGTLWKPVDVMPQYAILNVAPDAQSTSKSVRVVNNEEQPLVISSVECNNRAFATELKTNQPGKEFELVVSTVPPLAPGNVQGQITLKTSSTNAPVITVTAIAYVQPAISVMPPQLGLAQGPLPSKQTPAVTIVNNTTNTLQLSEPAINAKDVEVNLQEVRPGKMFVAKFTFPEGFAAVPGQPIAFTVKTSDPRFPQIKVPVYQVPRPLAAPAAPATAVPVRPAIKPATATPIPSAPRQGVVAAPPPPLPDGAIQPANASPAVR